MKFIDEKGRLFEKVNIIDLFIVLFVIAALFAVNYKLGLVKNIHKIEQVQNKHTIKIIVKDIAAQTVDAISKGDIVKESRSNSAFGKIINKEVRPYKTTASDLNGQWVLSTIPERYEAILTIENESSGSIENLKLGSIEAKVGASITINGPKFQVMGYVYGVE